MIAYDIYVKIGKSIMAVQQFFCVHFNLRCHYTIASCNMILRWVHSLKTKGNMVKKKSRGSNKTGRKPQNVSCHEMR